jgi:formamidopyrimidine-DNA glycosylase
MFHERIRIRFADGAHLTFNDARRFGLIDLVETGEEESHSLFQKLGPEPLEKSFTPARLAQQLKGRKTALKVALLDQTVVVGVGNIYASEALYRAGINPSRAAGSLNAEEVKKLTAAIKAVLKAAIAAGGSSLRDYVQSDGELGYFQHNFKVYNRTGQPCPGCTCNAGVERFTQAGRSTFWCPVKQR